jgi:hypothetical protein
MLLELTSLVYFLIFFLNNNMAAIRTSESEGKFYLVTDVGKV